ncbi:LysR family transcriptional regulator [Cupriavidus malaysiensis]|uniref:HTH lysR-type domain-containing protein n=1 Tax=Cupriavidus malaysiensis TaxID=367825 RepID=A0ABN4TW33_9BURK|nr:LysR family transcriptional regulator [Cupriavidus malaysiensis]AOZ11174.1 hypothetical protein BKK80_35060 [Cupriavidus malaysiensis]
MEIRQLHQFVAVAETGNFHRAAERLSMQQAPLSIAIRKLEAELGVELFVRPGRGMRGIKLSSAGEAVLAEARQALFHAEQTRVVAAATRAGTAGKLRVAFVGSATYALLPKLIPLFRGNFPNVELILQETTSTAILRGVEGGEIDVGFVRGPILTYGPAETTAVELTTIETDELVLAVPRDGRFSKRRSIHLESLRDEPIIMYSQAGVPNLNAIVRLLFHQAGLAPRVSQEVLQVQTLVAMVESGLGIGLVPGATARYASQRVRFLRLLGGGPTKHITLSMAHRGLDSSPQVLHFVRTALGVAGTPTSRRTGPRRRPSHGS